MMNNKIRFFLVNIFCFSIISCGNNKVNNYIKVGCEKREAKNDINYSIKQNEELIKKYNITVLYEDVGFCGYIFTRGKEIKNLKGANTDVDLMMEIKDFFGNVSK